jgi:alkylated DNA repair protein alkB family protein 4
MDDPVPMPPLLATRPLLEGPGDRRGDSIHIFDPETQRAPTCPDFKGVRLYNEFLSHSDEEQLLGEIGETPLNPSQSGKRKQHYGAKVNFNKKRMNPASFHGIPRYAHALEARLRSRIREDHLLTLDARRLLEDALARFETTDVFVLRYQPEESSNLDFHLDDAFAYGEMILDVSLESDSVLTFLRGRPNSEIPGMAQGLEAPVCVRVPLPARSIAVLYGPARKEWEHAILDYDIEAQRTSITLRTLSEPLRATEEGREVMRRARADADADADES